MIGRKLADRYELTGELGRGGMGVVYRARDPLLNREVAVKLIPPHLLNPDTEQRFQREAQIVAQMDHPSIVPIFDLGRHEESLFFVMPLVQGVNLHAFRRERSALGDVVEIGIQVAEALDYSHQRGIVHRDIKPENIMVSHEAGALRVRVMDFGLARASSESRLTKSGVLIGTLAYLSPEQVAGRQADARSDLYSLGTVLYECAAGSPPFTGDTQSILYRIVHEVPQGPRALGAQIDDDFERVILACLEKEPGKRPRTAGEVAELLRRYRSRLRDSDRERELTGLTLQVPRPAVSPFVGRGKEFAELQQRLNAALAGEGQFVVVSGEAGIGKTRLVDELATLAKVRQVRVLRGRSVEQDRSLPYQGFCELVQDYFRQAEARASGPAPDLADIAGELVALFPMLNEIAEIRQAAGSSPKLAPTAPQGPEDRTQVFELLARTLTRLGGGRPLVLVLEDLHGAEVTVEALPYVVTRLGPTPTLILGTYRTTEVDERHPLTRVLDGFRGERRFSALTLGPFSPSDHRALLETLVGGPELSDGLVERLFDATKGNAFFTRELVRSLLEAGTISRAESGEWGLSRQGGISADVLPATIQQAVEKRLRQLPDDLREILSTAAVIGNTFDSRDLEALAKGTDVDDAIDRLVEQGLIEEQRETRGELLSFSSGVVRDVLYAGLSPRKRRSLHRKAAEILEARHAGRLERVLPQLVHHSHEGDLPEKAVEHGLRLARASLDVFSAEEAARAARTALDFLDEEWAGGRALEGEARLLLARAHGMSGDGDAALREAAGAVRIFEEHGPPARAVAALRLAAETAWQARRSDEADLWVQKGLHAARAAGEREDLRQLLSLAATLANLLGEQAKANAYLEEAAGLAPEAREATVEEALPRGGRLVVALANPVPSIEPSTLETNEALEISSNVYESLLATDARGSVMPSICEKWEARDGGRTFVLTLRKGVRFSDGAGVSAGDVKASIETCVRLVQHEMPPAYSAIRGTAEFRERKAEAIEGLVVGGEDTLEIHLLEPLPIYPALLTSQTGVVRAAAPSAGERPRLVGTGPFVVASQDAERIVLERSPQYWKGAPPPLDAVEFRTYSSAPAIARAYRAGEVDLARDLLPEDLEEILRDPRSRRGFVETPKRNTYFVLFNSLSGPLAVQDALRHALSGVLRTSDLVWRTLGRFAQPAVCLIPPGMLGHDPGRRARLLTLEEAREALRAVGEAPLRLRASVHPLFKERYASLLAALFATWSELGIEVEVTASEMAAYLASWEAGRGFDLMIGRWNTDYDDPDNVTHTLFHSRGGLWRTWFSSEAADRILEEARTETRPAVRDGLYRKFEALLQDTAALVPLFHDIDYRLAGPKVRGLNLRGTAPYVSYPQIGKAEAAVSEAEPVRAPGGVLHVPVVGVLGSLDPAISDTVEAVEVLSSTFESLTRLGPDARVLPWLAEEFAAEEGGLRYRFRLREDVRFHDGRRLSARDARYSFERLLQHKDHEFPWLLAPIKGAKAVLGGDAGDLAGFRILSATEFTIELEEPLAFFPAVLTHPAASIIPEGSDPSAGPEGWIGTGPFRVVAFEAGRRVQLERNRSYWRKGHPRTEGLVFAFDVAPKDVLSGFRAGRYSLASDLFPADVEALRRDAAFASGYRETPGLITYFACFNVHRGPLADRALRQRIVRALDVPKLVRQTLGRLALPASSLIPPGLLGHVPLSRTQAGAEEVQGRSEPPLELSTSIHPVFFGGYSAFARELESLFARAGFKLRVANKTMEELLEAERSGSVDLTVARWSADYADADTFVHILQSQAGKLGRLCGSPEIDRLIERARRESSLSVRHSLYREVEETVAREALLVPLFHEQAYRFARPEVEGLAVSFSAPAVDYSELRLRS